MTIVREVTDRSEIKLSTKMCIGVLYIYARKASNIGSNRASFNISSEYVIGENCSYIHQNSFAYCGESNLDDCRNCRRQGCTVIECGNEYSRKNVK